MQMGRCERNIRRPAAETVYRRPALKPVMVVVVSTPPGPEESKASMSPLRSRECPPNAAWLDGNRNGRLAWAPWEPSRPGHSLVCPVPSLPLLSPGGNLGAWAENVLGGCTVQLGAPGPLKSGEASEASHLPREPRPARASQPAGQKQPRLPRPSTFPRLMGRGSRGKGQGARSVTLIQVCTVRKSIAGIPYLVEPRRGKR